MPVLNNINNFYLGSTAISRVYKGSVKFWPPSDDLPASASSAVHHIWIGDTQSNSVIVTARADSATEVIMVASTNSSFSGQLHSAPITPTSYSADSGLSNNRKLAKGQITGLSPNTTYYLGVAVNGIIDTTMTGKCKTPPSSEHSFKFATASCGDSRGNTSVQQIFNNLRKKAEDGDIDFFFHTGDLHYQNISTNEQYRFNDAYDHFIFGSARYRGFFRSMPIYYMWDDHDYGPNNSDSTSASRNAATSTFRQRVPVSLVETGTTDACYYAFTRGRVRFIVTDLRSEASTNSTPVTKLGSTQKTWFKAQCIAARDAGQAICWVCTLPWVIAGPASSSDDHWGRYQTERSELVTFFENEGLEDRMFTISGDMHAMAFVSATDNPYGDFPCCHAAPLDQNSSHKLQTYTLGPFPSSEAVSTSNVGIIEVTDTGTSTVGIRFRGINVSRGSGSSLDAFGTETEQIDTSFNLSVAAPIFVAPTISTAHISTTQGGSAASSPVTLGTTLWAVATDVTGTPTPTLTYDWKVNTVSSGITTESFNTTGLEDADSVTVTITATNSEGSDNATSSAILVEDTALEPFRIEFLGWHTAPSSGSTGTTYTITAADLGAAPPSGDNKVIVLACSVRVSGSGSTAPTISFTGQSPTQVSNVGRSSSSSNILMRSYSGLNAVTSNDITVTHPARIDSLSVAVWAIYRGNYTASATGHNGSANDTIPLSTPAGGVSVRYFSAQDVGVTPVTWSATPAITKHFDGQTNGNGETASSGHAYNTTGSSASHSGSVDQFVTSVRGVAMAFAEQT